MKRLFSLLGWIFALAFLAVGLRNFEAGLSMDGPLYATIARNLAQSQSGSWFRLTTSIPEFQPFFAEHPHLGFWVLAAVFEILPAADWSARIPSHLFYVLFLLLIYSWIAELSRSRRAGALAVVLIWAFPILSNFFSNAYLDPQALVLGTFAVYALERAIRPQAAWPWALFSGLALAGSALTKGFTVLGFGPAMAFLVVNRFAGLRREALSAAIVCLTSSLAILLIYALLLSRSEVPAFLDTYVTRQWSQRFAVSSDGLRLLDPFFYKELARETHWLLVVIPVWLWIRKRSFPSGDAAKIPLILLASFVLMYVPAGRVGHQYWLMLLPWAAWWLALALDSILPASWSEVRFRKVTMTVSIVLVVVLQYFPFRVYRSRVPSLAPEIAVTARRIGDEAAGARLWIEDLRVKDPFIRSGTWAWYTGLPVDYFSRESLVSGTRVATDQDIFAIENFPEGARRRRLIAQLKERGLCVAGESKKALYWTQCRWAD